MLVMNMQMLVLQGLVAALRNHGGVGEPQRKRRKARQGRHRSKQRETASLQKQAILL